jgi:NADPH2:quinone reductase
MQELPHSIKICYPTFRDHIASRAELLAHSAGLFAMIASGKLAVAAGRRYPLAEPAQAHRDLEFRRTTGKLLLLIGTEPATKD